jgi:hypothetical protein
MEKLIKFIRFFSICQTFFGFFKKKDLYGRRNAGMEQQKGCL